MIILVLGMSLMGAQPASSQTAASGDAAVESPAEVPLVRKRRPWPELSPEERPSPEMEKRLKELYAREAETGRGLFGVMRWLKAEDAAEFSAMLATFAAGLILGYFLNWFGGTPTLEQTLAQALTRAERRGQRERRDEPPDARAQRRDGKPDARASRRRSYRRVFSMRPPKSRRPRRDGARRTVRAGHA